MNPIYKFQLSTVYGGTTTTNTVYPLYKADLAKDYEIEQNERFYRAKLNGKLQFVGPDFDRINNAAFECRFVLIISISWDAGQNWTEYWRGEFWKTDCKFDADNKTIEVSPAPVDDYTAVLAGMDKEYNLIDLKPEIEQITLTKRPMIQIYVPGESIISCFLSNMYWEQDCEVVSNENALVVDYHFALCDAQRTVRIDGDISPDATGLYYGTAPAESAQYNYTKGQYKFAYHHIQTGDSDYVIHYWEIIRVSDNVVMWRYQEQRAGGPSHTTGEFTLTPISGTGATGNANVYVADIKVYARLIVDVKRFLGLDTYKIPANDMVENNRNYHYVIGYNFPNSITFYERTTDQVTEWGIKNPGEYYQKPYSLFIDDFYPIGRSHWGELSIWYSVDDTMKIFEKEMQNHYVMRDANPLHSVISVLLAQIAPGITHEATTEYSQFLYANYNPISFDRWYLYLTQKSNILAGEYQQPAQNAPITLKMVTDMLRNCFCAYWYIENGKFKIEHIYWFKNGGSYSGSPVVSHDLTVEQVKRNGKKWAFETSQFEYEKPTMPERYQFGWMDDVTKQFNGQPIEILSKFVQAGNIEEITVNNFTSDIDYMLLNPGGCSKDGFALMAAVAQTPWDGMNFRKSNNRLITDKLSITKSILNVTISGATGKHYRLAYYNGDTIIAYSSWHTDNWNFPIIGEKKQVAFEFENIDGSDIDEDAWILFTGGVVGLINHVPVIREYDVQIAQNPYLAFPYLQNSFYGYDLPAYNVKVNGVDTIAYGIQRNKKQTIKFPVAGDPNPLQLIRTNLGNGQIQKISINLSNRNANATLMYDTYNENE